MNRDSPDLNTFKEMLSLIKADESAPDEPDEITKSALANFALEERKAALALKEKRAVKSESLADTIVWIVMLYLVSIIMIVTWQGMLPAAERLNTTVMVTLLSTTTANVLALLFLLIKYVFDDWLQK